MTIALRLRILKWDIKEFFGTWKRRIWNKHIKLAWDRLWIRKNEFHSSLSMDAEAMLEMNQDEQDAYLKDLMHRRAIAHRRDLERLH